MERSNKQMNFDMADQDNDDDDLFNTLSGAGNPPMAVNYDDADNEFGGDDSN